MISLAGEVNRGMVKVLLDGLKMPGEHKVLFSSWGGYTDSMQAMLYILEQERDRVELVGYGDLSSAAFVIFFTAACKKTLLPSTTGMAHLQAMDISLTQSGKARGEGERWNMQELRKEKEDWVAIHKKIGLNPKELSKMAKGGDVYFSYSRMKELLIVWAVYNAINNNRPSETV